MAQEKDKEVVAKVEEGVTLSKGEFAALMERLNRLENPGMPIKQKRSTEHIGFLRIWEGCIVTTIGKVKEDFTLPQSHQNRMVIEIGIEDMAGVHVKKVVNYLNFITEASKVRAKFLKVEHKPRAVVDEMQGGGGVVTKVSTETGKPTGETIELEVSFNDTHITVEVIEGDFTGKVYSFTPETISAINA